MTDGAAFLGLGARMSQRTAPTCDWTDMGSDAHFVQFFESDDFIINEVSEYVVHGLRSGETCLVVATKEHLDGIDKAVKKHVVDLAQFKSEGRYLPLDAHETLLRICTDGCPNKEKFSAVIGSLLDTAEKNGDGIRVFGEMVGILCSQDKFDSAIKLEGFWNELKKAHYFSLFCAYSMRDLSAPDAGRAMASICSDHGQVLPSESYTSITSTKERLEHIAFLQQRTKELEAEVLELEQRIAAKQQDASSLRVIIPSMA